MRTKTGLVHGVGVNDYEGSVTVDGKTIKSYSTWQHMLNRCYSSKCQSKYPTYIGCSVCNEWKSFSTFKLWFDENYKEGFHLDKDILVKGNKIYSPEFCRFVPSYLNTLLSDCGNSRGDLPLGVCKHENGYQSQCQNGQGKRLKKCFKTIEQCQQWYSTTKKQIVKEQAIRAFMSDAIKTDIYLALVRRNF